MEASVQIAVFGVGRPPLCLQADVYENVPTKLEEIGSRRMLCAWNAGPDSVVFYDANGGQAFILAGEGGRVEGVDGDEMWIKLAGTI